MKQADLYDIVTKLVAEMDEDHRLKLVRAIAVPRRPAGELISKLGEAKLVKVGEMSVWKVATTFNALLNYLGYHHSQFYHLSRVQERVKKMQRPHFMEVGELYDTWNKFVSELIEQARTYRPVSESVDS